MENWYEEENNFEEDDYSVVDYNITSSPNDFNIMTLCNFIDAGIVKIPAFQRNYVWDIKSASKLIESIIIGLPIPQLFLYEKEKNKFLVIDGQQRLLSIYFFVKQKFPTDLGKRKLREILTSEDNFSDAFFSDDKYFSDFRLKLPSLIGNNNKSLNGLKYQTLGEHKNIFEYIRIIRCIVIKQNDPKDDESSMYEIFNRLNSGGQHLTPQEIRMSLFYSKFYDQLIELNKNPIWRTLLNNPETEVHFKDVEIILRGYALLVHHDKYKSPMNKFLNSFSRESTCFEEETVTYFNRLFIAFLNTCKALNPSAFLTKSGKFSISVFDSIFVAMCDNAFKNKNLEVATITNDKIEAIKSNSDFIKSTQESVASVASVTTRIRVAKEILYK
ncbi:MAG: DUF262 domain-containing protein [Clostridiales bacterium]|nr:DUF262 domain-containing protein [Clostridiales bacterium]